MYDIYIPTHYGTLTYCDTPVEEISLYEDKLYWISTRTGNRFSKETGKMVVGKVSIDLETIRRIPSPEYDFCSSWQATFIDSLIEW